jgi:PRTRC genetic system ThiF family protein
MMLHFDPRHYLSEIVLVGCGGTGAQWGRAIARLLRMLQDAGKQTPKVKFIDPDVIEAQNIGRQLFHDSLIGENKAIELARRFNLALGLGIEAVPEAFDPKRHIERYSSSIICGAVDNWQARQNMAAARDCTWIDAGNARTSGQVIIGTTCDVERMRTTLQRYHDDEDIASVSWLPNVAAVYPELLQPDPEDARLVETLSCAELLERSLQSATINGLVAGVGAEYLRKLLYREPIHSWITHIDSVSLTMRSVPITLQNIVDNTPGLQDITRAAQDSPH